MTAIVGLNNFPIDESASVIYVTWLETCFVDPISPKMATKNFKKKIKFHQSKIEVLFLSSSAKCRWMLMVGAGLCPREKTHGEWCRLLGPSMQFLSFSFPDLKSCGKPAKQPRSKRQNNNVTFLNWASIAMLFNWAKIESRLALPVCTP